MVCCVIACAVRRFSYSKAAAVVFQKEAAVSARRSAPDRNSVQASREGSARQGTGALRCQFSSPH